MAPQPRPARVALPPGETLAWEDRWRNLALIATIAAAVLPLGGAVLGAVFTSDAPTNSPGRLLFYSEHGASLIFSSLLLALGGLAVMGALLYLYGATRHRRPETPTLARVCAIGGPIVLAIAQVVSQAIVVIDAGSFADGATQTYQAAQNVFEGDAVRVAATVGLFGQLALGLAFGLISLNAMRAGLLTRFMGVLGIIVGVLFVLPIGSPLPIVQTFWLGALCFLVARRWPAGMPRAWDEGRAVAWPSQQELREQAMAARAERAASKAGADDSSPKPIASSPEPIASSPEPEDVPVPTKSHSASKKRKRKRRN